MIHDHGQIHISLHKPIKFQMRTNAILIGTGSFFASKNVDVIMATKSSWLGFVVQEKTLSVVGLKVGNQKVEWYYNEGFCAGLFADVHRITFIVDKESRSGENITVHNSQFYRGQLPFSNVGSTINDHSNNNNQTNDYFLTNTNNNQQQTFSLYRTSEGPSKEFLFFDEAFRLLDKILYQSGRSRGVGSLRELFCHLARNSLTGRIPWGDLLGFFPSDWEPSYFHAVERIIQLMRQAMDHDQVTHRELRRLIELGNEIVKERQLQINQLENNNSSMFQLSTTSYDLTNTFGFWKSAIGRLRAIASSPEQSIDELALTMSSYS